MEALERVLGEHWGRAMWIEACRRAGVAPAAAMSPSRLRRIADELAEVPGPAGVIGRTLLAQVHVYEDLKRRSAA